MSGSTHTHRGLFSKIVKFIFLLGLIIMMQSLAFSQIFINNSWESQTNQTSGVSRTVSQIDGQKNLIIVSSVLNTANTNDVFIAKYDPFGNEMWQYVYNGSGNGNDYGVQVHINEFNEIFVLAALKGNNMDIGLLKLSSAGDLIWSTVWNSNVGLMDIPTNFTIDLNGNIVIVGMTETSNSFFDYLVIKFDPLGNNLWDYSYDYIGLHDGATGVAIRNNEIIVTGGSASAISNWDYAILSLTQEGILVEAKRVEIQGLELDNPIDIITDSNNNIYVTGYSDVNGNKNFQTIKIDNAFNLVWIKTLDDGYSDIAKDILFDNDGNVIVVGFSENQFGENNIITIVYDVNGNELWQSKYLGNGDAIVSGAAVDIDGNIIVAGTLTKNGDKDFVGILYSSNGNLIQTFIYGDSDTDESVEAVVVDDGHIYFSGVKQENGIDLNTTVKFDIIKKENNFFIDSDGRPIYVDNELIVRIDEQALNMENIDNKGFLAGKIEDFIKSEYVAEIRQALRVNCKSDNCQINVYKIFKELTSDISTTITRRGDVIDVPHFWATLVFEFPEGLELNLIHQDLKSTFPLVKYAHLNVIAGPNSVPTDEIYTEQGSLHETNPDWVEGHIKAERAWTLETGKPFVKVGVFDSGIHWSHEEFSFISEPMYSKVRGWDFEHRIDATGATIPQNVEDQSLGDPSGHGTSVAGIIGAFRNNKAGLNDPYGIGIAGIGGGDLSSYDFGESDMNILTDNWGVSLFSLRIFQSDYFETIPGFPSADLNPFSLLYIADAIASSAIDIGETNYNYGIHLSNHSWGLTDGFDQFIPDNIALLSEVIHFSNRAQVTQVVAVGNSGAQVNEEEYEGYPAEYNDDWVVTVGGTGWNGEYKVPLLNSSTSWRPNTSESIDLAAPCISEMIWSPTYQYVINQTSPSNNQYNHFNGVSSAAPHVTGVASLLMSYLDTETPSSGNLAPEDVEQILQLSADYKSVGGVAPDVEVGFGLLNATNALNFVDKSLNKLEHYDHLVSAANVNMVASNQTIQLSEVYYNEENTWFEPGVDYIVDVYKVDATVNHNLDADNQIIAYWPRPSSSNLLKAVGSNLLTPHEKITINNLNQSTANLEGYAYKVKEADGTLIGWIPFDPTVNPCALSYTILYHDPSIVSKLDNIIKPTNIKLSPNPTLDGQTLSFDLKTNVDLKIDLIDMEGRLIKGIVNTTFAQGHQTIDVDLADLTQGVYFYSIQMGKEIHHLKTIKL